MSVLEPRVTSNAGHGFPIFSNPSHFCMWNFVSGNKPKLRYIEMQNCLIVYFTMIQYQCTSRLEVYIRRYTLTPHSCTTVGLLNSPWSSPKNVRFRKFWKSYLDQNLLRITDPVSDLTGDQ